MVAPSREHRRVCVARIGAAHGVRGEVKLWAFTADPMAVVSYGELQAEDGRAFEIEAVRPAKDFLVARIKGVADRDAAQRLCNTDLYVPRERLPQAEGGEYYHVDLIGLTVEDPGGARLGTIAAVHNFGAGDLLEVQPIGGGETVMVPFTDAVVPVVDIAGEKLIMRPPAGAFAEPRERQDAERSAGIGSSED